jgi:hypothetical protein
MRLTVVRKCADSEAKTRRRALVMDVSEDPANC